MGQGDKVCEHQGRLNELVVHLMGASNEPATPQFPASRRWRRRSAGTVTHRTGGQLPVPRGPYHCRLRGGWHALAAPKGVPADVVALISKTVAAGLEDPAFKKKLVDLGSLPMPMTSTEFGKYVIDDIAKWAKVIKFANIKAD